MNLWIRSALEYALVDQKRSRVCTCGSGALYSMILWTRSALECALVGQERCRVFTCGQGAL